MITTFLTEVRTSFNPFRTTGNAARIFLSFLPPNARQTMKVTTKLLPRVSKDPSIVELKFKDGKEMKLDPEKLGIKGIIEEVDRHSRILGRAEELNGN
ncbi:mitochondrial ribosomal protein L44 [Amylocarpus encephaloides]|uniref:Large ribosomal subunit protein mL53 n=1 Tax=Amylocarpus encephaloides TaxID=45428 RepID=A0A9P7YMH6_9HELO|nr:mitochondrial ribosomal protein L44 [Amylocarpus encephaloides]